MNKNSFQRFMENGSEYQKSLAGEEVFHLPANGPTQQLKGLVNSLRTIEKSDGQGTVAKVTTGLLFLVQDEIATPISRKSKFRVRETLYNFDEQQETESQGVWLIVPIWADVAVRKGEEGYRRETI